MAERPSKRISATQQPGPNLEIGPRVQDRVQVGVGAGVPCAVFGGVDLEPTRAVADGFAAVERHRGHPDIGGRLENRCAARIIGRYVTKADGPGEAPHERCDLGGAPPVGAHGHPLVEAFGGRPERDARVVRRAAAEHLATRVPHERVAPFLRLHRIVPVVTRVEQMHPFGQHQDVVVADVGRTRFQKADSDVRILRKPRGQCASRRTATGDHIIECAGITHVTPAREASRPRPPSPRRATAECRCGGGP